MIKINHFGSFGTLRRLLQCPTAMYQKNQANDCGFCNIDDGDGYYHDDVVWEWYFQQFLPKNARGPLLIKKKMRSASKIASSMS